MNGFMKWMEKYIMPTAAKIGSQRHLVAIRDAFVAMIPLTMAGAFAVLINNLPIDAYQNFMTSAFGESWKSFGGTIWWGTLAIMALFLVIGIAYYLAKSYDENALQAAMIAVACYVIFIPEMISGDWGLIPVSYLGTTALFTAIIVGIISTEIYVKLGQVKKMHVNLPEGVPPAVMKSFKKLIPGMLTVVIMTVAFMILSKIADGQALNDLINTYLSEPLKGVADSLPGAVVITLFIHVLWTFGLHGANIASPITSTLLLDLGGQNAELVEAGVTTVADGLNVLAGPFYDAFVFLGGSGATIGLIVAILIASKRRKDMVALGAAPGLFNINEPVIFGLPIVLNPIFMIPFVLGPMIMTVVAYLAISTGIVAPVIVPTIPWVTPPILGGLAATGHWTGGLLAAVNLVISIVIYFPFVVASEKMYKKEEERAAQANKNIKS